MLRHTFVTTMLDTRASRDLRRSCDQDDAGWTDRHDLLMRMGAAAGVPALCPRGVAAGGRSPDGDHGIFFRARAGCPWRDLPEGFGNWKTVYNRHRRWSLEGPGSRSWMACGRVR